LFEIGRSLRTAREHQQLHLAAVEGATHIRAKYLAALEDERFDTIPGTAYARGFLRTYADFLGLDGPRFVDEFNERFAPAEPPEAPAPVRVERPPRLLTARLLLIPLAIGIGLLSWRLASGGGHTHHPAAAFTHVRSNTPALPPPAKPPPPKRAEITFNAARGPCWLSVRRGSASGPLLYERMLEPGQHASFAGARLWIRIGAPWNLDARLNGKPAGLPRSLGDVIVTPRAVRSL
jgi:cytoskeleton protein RodZ